MAEEYKPFPVIIQDGVYARLDLNKLQLIPDEAKTYKPHVNFENVVTDRLHKFMLVGFPEELETSVSYNYNMTDITENERTIQMKIRNGLEKLIGEASKLIEHTKAKFMLVGIKSIGVGHHYSEFKIKISAQGLVENQ